jgi:type I restriction enzyme S subunit
MIRLRLSEVPSVRKYIATIWSSRFIRSQIEKRARTTAGIYKISQGDIDRFIVPLPPLNEQVAIIEAIEKRFSVIDELEAVIAINLKRADRLRQAILKRAFEGKLVPQDPTDEPASMLLERIRAEHEQAMEKPKATPQKTTSRKYPVQPTVTTPVQGELALGYSK